MLTRNIYFSFGRGMFFSITIFGFLLTTNAKVGNERIKYKLGTTIPANSVNTSGIDPENSM